VDSDPGAFDPADAHAAIGPFHGTLDIDSAAGRRGQAEHVGVVFLVGRKHIDEDLHFVLEAFGKERGRSGRSHAPRYLLIGGAAFALKKPPGILPAA